MFRTVEMSGASEETMTSVVGPRCHSQLAAELPPLAASSALREPAGAERVENSFALV